MVSHFVDSCTKSLYGIADKLLTNSDFASSAKQTLLPPGNFKGAEIVQAIMHHFHFTLIEQKPEGDNT